VNIADRAGLNGRLVIRKAPSHEMHCDERADGLYLEHKARDRPRTRGPVT